MVYFQLLLELHQTMNRANNADPLAATSVSGGTGLTSVDLLPIAAANYNSD